MKEIHEYEKDIASIRHILERQVKVITLSGISGVLAGIYALIGAIAVYFITYYPLSPFRYRIYSMQREETIVKLVIVCTLVLAASLGTGLFFSAQRAKKLGVPLWSSGSRRFLINLAIPLVTGGIFVLILLANGHYGLAAPATLLFYGLGLIQASPNSLDEIRSLGFAEICLGLVSALFPGYGLLFWAAGFGILHIIYGVIMYRKYEA